MRLFRRRTPRDTNALFAVLTHGTIDELDTVYEPAWVNYDGYASGTLLTLSLSNSDTAQRLALANRLLDDGADVRRDRPLHVLLGRGEHDFDAEVQLLTRMLDAGADVNEVYPKFGTPLETIAAKFKYSDADIEPFYEILLARPDLDLATVSYGRRTVLENLRKMEFKRARLVARAEQIAADRAAR